METWWISELVNTCDTILWALSEENVMEELDSIIVALDAGEGIYEEIYQPAIDFRNSWLVMFTKLRPLAVGWVTRLDERVQLDAEVDRQVAEWPKR